MGKYEDLVKFKELLDKKVITAADYEKEKDKILARGDDESAEKSVRKQGASGASTMGALDLSKANVEKGLYYGAAIALMAYPLIAMMMNNMMMRGTDFIDLFACLGAGAILLAYKGKPKFQGLAALLLVIPFLTGIFDAASLLSFYPMGFFTTFIALISGMIAAAILAVQYFVGAKETAKNKAVKEVAKMPWFGFAPIVIAAAAVLYVIMFMVATQGFGMGVIFISAIFMFGPLFVLSYVANRGFKK